jgi:hypothetical protein
MNPLVLITSVINTPIAPLSYSNVRSVFSRSERFDQTKKTIQSIKSRLPDCKIVIVECSDLNNEESEYLNETCNYILNLWHVPNLHKNIFGISKSLGEGTMTIEALKYIERLGISYQYLYKISGRYWLKSNFVLDNIHDNVYKKIGNNSNNICTALYKIDSSMAYKLRNFLESNIGLMEMCIGFEVLMGRFLKTQVVTYVDIIGIGGFVTVCGSEYNG